MKKFLKNQKGFTLVELMMVIAVIGILAAVLIPKMGASKDSAKLSGVESNMRQVEAQIHALIERNKTNAGTLRTAIINALNKEGSDTAAADSGDVTNPFDYSKFGASATIDNNAVTVLGTAAPDDNASHKGLIHVQVIPNDTTAVTSIEITPYDGLGKKMTSTKITP